MRILVTLLTLVALLAPSVPAHPATAPDETLPADPALTMGRLPNGLRYIIRPHRNPEGRVGIWLHVGSGGGAMIEQEAALEFILFDLSSCVQDDNQPPAPPPPVK